MSNASNIDDVSQEKIKNDFSSFLDEKKELTPWEKIAKYSGEEDFAGNSWRIDILQGINVRPMDNKAKVPSLTEIKEELIKLSSELDDLENRRHPQASLVTEKALTDLMKPVVEDMRASSIKIMELFRELDEVFKTRDLMPKPDEVSLCPDTVGEMTTTINIARNVETLRKNLKSLNISLS